ncbi:unnamed protein product [Nezara viridula]|uniref:Neuropeptide n=1 Tax=Nezara viridula TaxID=85310 RepID=A0A9P0HV58_NEZVI|nr:unnamed protein product [Nezara viridula]
MHFIAYCSFLVIFAICEARYVPGEVPDFYAMVEPHMKVQIPKYIKSIAKDFKYAADEFAAIEKNVTIAKTQKSNELKDVTKNLIKESLNLIQATVGTKISDEKTIKEIEEAFSILTQEFLKNYESISGGIKVLKDDLLAKESLVDEIIKKKIPELIDDFVKKMKPEESKIASQSYVNDLKGPGREKVVAEVRKLFESEASKIEEVQNTVLNADFEVSLRMGREFRNILEVVAETYIKDKKQKEAVVGKLKAKADVAMEFIFQKDLDDLSFAFESAKVVINNTIEFVVDDIDYELKRLTNSLSVILMSTFD